MKNALFKKSIDQLQFDDIISIIPQLNSESHRFDFKAQLLLKSEEFKFELLRDIVSFANTWEESWIFYGVQNDRKICGLSFDYLQDIDHLQRHPPYIRAFSNNSAQSNDSSKWHISILLPFKRDSNARLNSCGIFLED